METRSLTPSMECQPHLTGLAGNPVPEHGRVFWLRTADGRRLRAAVWEAPQPQGSVLIFPGRTEPIELYFQMVKFLRSRRWSVATIDWRGQGRSERPLPDTRKSHVDSFEEYQLDASALLDDIGALPRPRVILGHSMGSAIALRRIHEHPDTADGVILCAPLIDIALGKLGNGIAWVLSATLSNLGASERYALARGGKAVSEGAFAHNPLTSSIDQFERLRAIEGEIDGLAVGSPTWGWLRAWYRERRWLRQCTVPRCPALAVISRQDRVVSVDALRRFASRSDNLELEILEQGRHSLLIERPEIRGAALDGIDRILASIARG